MPLQVLVVEDSEDDAKLMVLELERHDLEVRIERVETAEAMTAALDRQEWDLVLADYTLPHFGATLALDMVQKRGLDLPFILVSGTVGEERAVAVMKAGAHDFVLKNSLARLGPSVARELGEAEGRRQRRKVEAALKLLADIGKLLTEASDHDAVLKGAAELAVPTLADWCVLYSDGESSIADTVQVAHVSGVDADALHEFARSYRPTATPGPAERHPVAEALRLRKSVLTSEVTDDVLARIARDDAQRQVLQALRPRSLITSPLVVGGLLTGLWIFAATGSRRYSDADLTLAQEVVDRIALVAENARLSRAREAFLSTAVHEIKTPVTTMKMSVQLMKRAPEDQRSARLPGFLHRVDRQCNRLAKLVSDVLEVSRIELRETVLARRQTAVHELVEEVVNEMQGLSSSHPMVVTRNDVVTAEIDADKIEQVLINLLDNAIKYSPDGGEIEVASRLEADGVALSVRDQGVGIPADRQERIFERFFRAHAGTPYEHGTSLGVGLYVSREFVARHEGRMWFESREGEGTTFHVRLPLHPLSSPDRPLPPSPDGKPRKT